MTRDRHGRQFVDDERPEPDTRPGHYYVSCIDGPRTALLAGPFATHAEALAHGADDASFDRPGVLNARLGLPTREEAA